MVGASLGGLYAVRTLLDGLPADFQPPVVLAQHRRADADSRLTEILGGACPLPVIEPEDKETLRARARRTSPRPTTTCWSARDACG